ncbi:MlaD family protein [Salisaeta longa]|uniref:MlaD family protein n=1 Tax=Salisaeta longa TaxID=503170 RepID=UPI0003B4CB16|nr:MlaD family protein [Salisaeta longa]
MQYSNELKVGAALIIAAVIFFIGFRFFQGIPLFQERYTLQAHFDSAGGLVTGNPVTISGVTVGTVEDIQLDPDGRGVIVTFKVEDDITIPQGSYAEVAGFSALSGVRLAITLGPRTNPPLISGSMLSAPPTKDILERLSDQAPVIAAKADSTLSSANTALSAAARIMQRSSGDIEAVLRSLRQTLQTVESITQAEKENIRKTIQHIEGITADLKRFTGTNVDSLNITVDLLNRSLRKLNANLSNLKTSTATLSTITQKINQGRGTAGRLINDPSLYRRLDSAALNMNQVLEDLQQNPSRYLKDMTLVKVF